MFKLFVVLSLAVACVSAAPGGVLAAYSAPIAPAVVTATSSQVVARNYNGLAAPIVAAAPLAAAPIVAAPLKASPVVAAPFHAPYVAAAAPYVAGHAAPYVAAHAAPYVATHAAPYVAAHAAPYVAAPAALAAHAYYL